MLVARSQPQRAGLRLVGSWQDSRRYWASDARLRGVVVAPMLSWRLSGKSMLTLKLVAAEHWVFREPLSILAPSVTADTESLLGPGSPRAGATASSAGAMSARTTLISSRCSPRASLRRPSCASPPTGVTTSRLGAELPLHSIRLQPLQPLHRRVHPGHDVGARLRFGALRADSVAALPSVRHSQPRRHPGHTPQDGQSPGRHRHPAAVRRHELTNGGRLALSRRTGYGRGRLGTMPPSTWPIPGVKPGPSTMRTSGSTIATPSPTGASTSTAIRFCRRPAATGRRAPALRHAHSLAQRAHQRRAQRAR